VASVAKIGVTFKTAIKIEFIAQKQKLVKRFKNTGARKIDILIQNHHTATPEIEFVSMRCGLPQV
jgi:hypothetical protein